jgi:hypothetical protein
MMKSINTLTVFNLHANQGQSLKCSTACSVIEIPHLGNMGVFHSQWDTSLFHLLTAPHITPLSAMAILDTGQR